MMPLAYSLMASSALAGLALYKKALTAAGTLLAFALCAGICRYGGLPAFLILAVTFMATVAADKLAGHRADPYLLRRKSGRRDAWRVLCNVGVGALAVLLRGVTGREKFLLVYAAVMAESLSDSLASKIGPLFKGKTVDICSFKKLPTGLSGGVSAAGTIAALGGSMIIGGLSMLLVPTVKTALLVALTGFAGCLFDSVIGSAVQVKYYCPACGSVTESGEHCGEKTIFYKGLRLINNDGVNMLSNAFSFLLALFCINQ